MLKVPGGGGASGGIMEVSFQVMEAFQVDGYGESIQNFFSRSQGGQLKQRHCEYNLLQDIWAVGG